MKLPIYLYGSAVLRERAEDADLDRKDEIAALVENMKETLKSADGCGLAAPQVGVSLRVLIVDGTVVADVYDYLKDFRRTMINPVVLEESSQTCDYSEGCLSVPGIYADVRRPSKIKIEYYDDGKVYPMGMMGMFMMLKENARPDMYKALPPVFERFPPKQFEFH